MTRDAGGLLAVVAGVVWLRVRANGLMRLLLVPDTARVAV